MMSQRQTAAQPNETAIIVGGGLGGLMMAIRLARRRYNVTVYERRTNVGELSASQRSFTVTLSKRGLQALAEIDLREAVLAHTQPLRGRVVHDRDGATTFVPYGKNADEQLHAIRRHEMNALLYRAACRYPNIQFHFQQRLLRLEKADNRLWFQDECTPEAPPTPVQAPLVIGADGIFSVVRQQMHKGERADYHQDCLDWGYKDVIIPAIAPGQHAMVGDALHIWPRGHCTFFAFPIVDGSYAGNFIAPFTLAERITSVEAATALLESDFADLLAVAPALPYQLATQPMAHFITTYTAPWFYQDKIVLLGDAVHGVTPFWGEGMNAAYEDSSVLDRCLAEKGADRAAAFAQYQAERKPNTDLLADLAKQNFIELRDTGGSLRVMARKRIERQLYQLLPTQWLPLNIMISHSLMSYRAAVARYEQQQRWARRCGLDLLVWLVVLWLVLERVGKKLWAAVAHFHILSRVHHQSPKVPLPWLAKERSVLSKK
jgi:kynurenine 3-monooxygenase